MLTYREMNQVWLLLGLDNRADTGFDLSGWRANEEVPTFHKLPRDSVEATTISWNEFTDRQLEITRRDNSRQLTIHLQLTRQKVP